MGKDPNKLLEARSIAEQEQIFDEYFGPLFNNRLVRWMGRQPVAVYSLGIPPSQHAAMLEESGGSGQNSLTHTRNESVALHAVFLLMTTTSPGRHLDAGMIMKTGRPCRII